MRGGTGIVSLGYLLVSLVQFLGAGDWVGCGNDDVWSMINEKYCYGSESQLSGWHGLRACSWGGNVSGRQVGNELV